MHIAGIIEIEIAIEIEKMNMTLDNKSLKACVFIMEDAAVFGVAEIDPDFDFDFDFDKKQVPAICQSS